MSQFHNTGMSKIGASLTSTIRTDRGSHFGKANDRFRAPTQKKPTPSPQAYFLSDSIGYDDATRNSPFKTLRNGRAVFGRENRSRQFDSLIAPIELIQMPGPGQYSHQT